MKYMSLGLMFQILRGDILSVFRDKEEQTSLLVLALCQCMGFLPYFSFFGSAALHMFD